MGNETATEAGNANQRTLYERLGGEAGIGLVVERFYRRVQTDAELEPYFGGIDIVKLIEHQRIFISFATGGPDYYAARSLTQSHEHLFITAKHFDDALGHMTDALIESGVNGRDITGVLNVLAPLKSRLVRESK